MKKFIGWSLSYLLFYVDNAIILAIFFRPYQKLMGWSYQIQEWGGGSGAWLSEEESKKWLEEK